MDQDVCMSCFPCSASFLLQEPYWPPHVRDFSAVIIIKNKFTSLQVVNMNDLNMNMNDPDLEDFNPTCSLEHWYFHTKEYRH